jgi:hypothetical protein
MTYAIFIAIWLLLLLTIKWCFLPRGRLPKFRTRYLLIRLRLRLHPGRGRATTFELWSRWGRLAVNTLPVVVHWSIMWLASPDAGR